MRVRLQPMLRLQVFSDPLLWSAWEALHWPQCKLPELAMKKTQALPVHT